MLPLHSASNDIISHLQNFAKERSERKKEKTPNTILQQKINALEKKIAFLETQQTESISMIVDFITSSTDEKSDK